MNFSYNDKGPPLLEILIGTYNRPERVISAINSCLNLEDERILVSCNSNCKENQLNFLINYHPRLRYSYFEKNMGAHANWRKLLKESTGKFCLLLSDEDTVDEKALKNLIDFLKNNLEKSVISCGILNSSDSTIYFSSIIPFKELDLKRTLVLYPEQTPYISGYVFNVDFLKKIDLNFYLKSLSSNVYFHINIAHKLLEFGNYSPFPDFLILKGEDEKKGGHAYEHENTLNNNIKLNPEVYSSFARATQFYYMHWIIRKSFPNASSWQLLIYDLDLIVSFYFGVKKGNENCGMNDIAVKEVYRALNYAKNSGEYYSNFSSFIFKHLFEFDASLLISFIRRLLSAYRAYLIKYSMI